PLFPYTTLFRSVLQVAGFLGVFRRLAERHAREVLIRDRNVEAVAERAQVLLGELFLLVGDHLAFAALAEPEALHGLRQDDGGLALVTDRRRIRRVHLARV